MGKLIIMVFSIVLAIFMSSCESFKEHQRFAYAVIENPDKYDSLWRNSIFYDTIYPAVTMVTDAPWNAGESALPYYLDKIKDIFTNNQYNLDYCKDFYNERKKIRSYSIYFNSPNHNHFLSFHFNYVNNKWVLEGFSVGQGTWYKLEF